MHPSINPPPSCNFLSIHPSCYTAIYVQACLLNHLSITSTRLPELSSFIHLHLANNLSSRPPTPKTYTNSNLLCICSSFILSYTSFTRHLAINLLSNTFALSPSIWQLPQPASSNRDQSKNRGKHVWRKLFPYLEEDLSCHGEPMSDDWLLIWGTALPAIQLHAAAASQQCLAIHFRRWDPRKLTSWRTAEGERLNVSYSYGTVSA